MASRLQAVPDPVVVDEDLLVLLTPTRPTHCTFGAMLAGLPDDQRAAVEEARRRGASAASIGRTLRHIGLCDVGDSTVKKHYAQACRCPQ